MRALSLDYLQTKTTSALTGFLLLLIGISAAVTIGLQFRTLNTALSAAEENAGHLEKLVQKNSGINTQTKLSPEAMEEAKQANATLQKLALPWEGLFKSLESSNPDTIALLAIQPDAGKQVMKLNGEAKDLNAMLDYIKQLQQDKILANISLLTHEISQRDPEKPVRFTLSATWRTQP
ncbi:PilN domain-containing protein [Sulfurirhabdus autotrophica]|uniref:Tfp pilus assembly protein PilN n=1 Tax=Sulfurirhabdus autotrophica TaxID=1706046 RepID=A0A4R3YCD1_9PROT|nr:PilN domain-containing protein [Sulfurirhabdus autotrophica]TCV89640.1 Tfp pilus assembly protein PilN [Sulfurirhabdus autotrophica]